MRSSLSQQKTHLLRRYFVLTDTEFFPHCCIPTSLLKISFELWRVIAEDVSTRFPETFSFLDFILFPLNESFLIFHVPPGRGCLPSPPRHSPDGASAVLLSRFISLPLSFIFLNSQELLLPRRRRASPGDSSRRGQELAPAMSYLRLVSD